MNDRDDATLMPTHDETSRLDRKLVVVLGPGETDTLFTLIWEANGRPTDSIDFATVYGRRHS